MEETNHRPSNKLRDANRLIRYHAIGGAAVGLVPMPLFDVALLTGVQVNLVRKLAQVYGMPFSEQLGRSLVSGLIGSGAPGLAWTMMKGVPIAGIISASIVSAASTYALGRIFVQHFESGGTFLTFDPDKVREHYVKEARKAASTPTGVPDDFEEDYSGIKP